MRVTAKAYHVRIIPKLYREWEIDPGGPADRELFRRMTMVQLRASKLVGVRTGKLLSTLRKERGVMKRKGLHWDVVAGQKGRKGTRYLGWHHYGTEPHIIKPRRKRIKALRWEANGVIFFRKKVMHPGTKGTFFLEFALYTAGAG